MRLRPSTAPGSLRVRYRASGTVRWSATARLRGNLPRDAGGTEIASDARATLEAALEEGSLVLEVELDGAPPELAETARARVLELAADALGGTEGGRASAAGAIHVEATAVADLASAFEPTADVADSFRGEPGADPHILIAPGSASKT